MNEREQKFIGYTCAYTPLPIIHAAGFIPYRVLPLTEAPDQAGSILHDNMCPHVKRILDRALDGDLPELSGMVFLNSCETMRRLADSWKEVRPSDRQYFLELPTTVNPRAIGYLAKRLSGMAEVLSRWSGKAISPDDLRRSIGAYNELADRLGRLRSAVVDRGMEGGCQLLQEANNCSVTHSLEETQEKLGRLEKALEEAPAGRGGVKILLFGNVLPDEKAFALFEKSGCQIVEDLLCTGAKQLTPIQLKDGDDLFTQLAEGILSRPPCARTIVAERPASLALDLAESAKKSGARGVLAHVMKFCDPYLARLPAVRKELKEKGLPLLILEGDCTIRSLGQHRTRIEAFCEMLGEGQ